jgi:hypothetical protein
MNIAKKTLATTQNFVANHKTALTIIATATVTAVVARKVQVAGLQEAYEFIDAKGLKDEFLNRTDLYGNN